MKCFLPLAAGLCFAMLACNRSSENEKDAATKDGIGKENVQSLSHPSTSDEAASNNPEMADSIIVYNNGSSSAAVQNSADTIHKFVRTADLKFQVPSVEKTVYTIEDIVSHHGGFVTLTQLNSTKENETTTPVSEDSAVETTHYIVTNTMTVRVPNTRLDTLLKDVAKLVGYLDYRVIKADDVSLQLRANTLQQKRSNRHTARLSTAIDKQGKKVLETTAAEEILEANEAAVDEASLSNLSLTDQISFSTAQFSIYQPTAVKSQTVALNKKVKEYETPFGKKVVAALQNGVEILETLFIGLLQLWPLLLLVGAGYWFYRKYRVTHAAGITIGKK